MIAYEVHINGKKICTAGLKGLGDICVHLNYRRGPHVASATGFTHDGLLSEVMIGGSEVRYKKKTAPHLKAGFRYAEALEWVNYKIEPGDEVTIKLVEAASMD